LISFEAKYIGTFLVSNVDCVFEEFDP